jgi:hypothetical protein
MRLLSTKYYWEVDFILKEGIVFKGRKSIEKLLFLLNSALDHHNTCNVHRAK